MQEPELQGGLLLGLSGALGAAWVILVRRWRCFVGYLLLERGEGGEGGGILKSRDDLVRVSVTLVPGCIFVVFCWVSSLGKWGWVGGWVGGLLL